MSKTQAKPKAPDFEDIDSTSDERTVNNTMRHQYRVLTDDEKAAMQHFKDMGEHFLIEIDALNGKIAGKSPREFSIAKTKIEEAVMWAVKGLTK